MKMKAKLWGALAAFLAAGVLATGAKAGHTASTPAQVNISVTISDALSVKVDGVASSTRTHTWSGTPNAKFVNSVSSITVLNDTHIRTEKWALSTNATSINGDGGAGWTIGTSTSTVGADEFALQAVFGSSNTVEGGCLGATAADWNNGTEAPLLTASVATYTSSVFGSSGLVNLGGSKDPDQTGGGMYAGNKRVLCYRAIMPLSTTSAATQNVQVVVTAQ